MRFTLLVSALVLGGCRLTTSIGSSEEDDTGTDTGGPDGTSSSQTSSHSTTGSGSTDATGTTAVSAGGSGTTSTNGTGFTGPGTTTGGSGTWGTGGPDPCHQYGSPMQCFSQGCIWSFRFDECHSDGGGGTGFNPPPQCEPSMQDSVCIDCLKFACCQALVACDQDPNCACFLSCLQQSNPILQCQGACQPSDGAAYLSMCAGNACFPSCG